MHIFKDVTYDANNNVSSLKYQISIATFQGQEWVVRSRHHKVVGATIFTHSQETILMLKTTTSVVKTMISGYNKMEDIFDLDVDLYTSNTTLLYMFIIFYGSLSKEGPPSLVENLATWFCPSLFVLVEVVLY